MTTHADLVAAVEKARIHVKDRNAHCDDLAALLALHRPFAIYDECGSIDCREFLPCQENKMYDLCFECSRLDPEYPMAPDPDIEVQSPCPTVAVVEDRLAAWGVL